MSESSMDEMKAKIMTVVGEFVDVDDSQEVDVSMNTDEELGTMYAVSIPVKRVKAEYDAYMLGAQFVYDDENVWDDE
jgi:septum formation topological specificity factor MinE